MQKECKEGVAQPVAQPGQPKTARINLLPVFVYLFMSIGGITIRHKMKGPIYLDRKEWIYGDD